MIKKRAISAIGYAIIFVIILGIIMIISAPMMKDKYKMDKNSPDRAYIQDDSYNSMQDRGNNENTVSTQEDSSSDNIARQLRIMEDRMNARLENIEAVQAQSTSSKTITDKYICNIEGNVDADGNVTSIDNMSMDEVRKRKIVFVCEYRN